MKNLIYALVLLSITACSTNNESNRIQPKRTDIVETVYASVKVVPSISYSPQPLTSGIIKEILVKEGDQVTEDQTLFSIEIPANAKNRQSTADLNLQEAKANYLGSSSLLRSIEAEIHTAQQQLTLDSMNFKQQERLWNQNIGKKNDYDRAKLAYTNTQNQVKILRQKKQQTLISLKNAYQKALNMSNVEKSQVGDYTVRSEINGIVFSINKEPGDFITTQERFGEIGTSDAYIIQMDIDEVDITKVAVGDSILISLDAYNDQVLFANVTKIYPKKEEATQTFRVEGKFIPPLPKLYNGFSGEANILVDKRINTLVIPSNYLLPQNKVLTNDGELTVKVGIKNLKYVEILEGVDTNTVLLKPAE